MRPDWVALCIQCSEPVPDETAGEFDADGALCFECLKEEK